MTIQERSQGRSQLLVNDEDIDEYDDEFSRFVNVKSAHS